MFVFLPSFPPSFFFFPVCCCCWPVCVFVRLIFFLPPLLSSIFLLFSLLSRHPPRVRSISGSRFSRRRLPTKAPPIPPFRSWWYWSVPCRVDAAAVAPSASLLLSRHFLGADYSTRVTHTRILRRSSVFFLFFSLTIVHRSFFFINEF